MNPQVVAQLREIVGGERTTIDETDLLVWECDALAPFRHRPDVVVKMERVRAANLGILVTGNPGCLFQLQLGARRHGLDVEVVHIAELLRRALPGSLDAKLV